MKNSIRIMVAADLDDVRTSLLAMLRDAGFEVLEACDGCEALELIEHPDSLDLIVTDINMPGFSGFEVAEHGRARHPEMPVIFVSGRPEQAAHHGIGPPVRCISKPVRRAELFEAVDGLLQGVTSCQAAP